MQYLRNIFKYVLFQAIICTSAIAQVREGMIITSRPDTSSILKEIDQAESISTHFPDSASKILNLALGESLRYDYKNGIRKTLYSLMTLKYQQKAFEQAIHYSNQLIAYCNVINQKEMICDALLLKGMCYQAMEQYPLAIESYQRVLRHASSRLQRHYAHFNISVVMSNIEQYEKALIYMNKAFSDTPSRTPRNYSNLANIHHRLGHFEKASIYFDSAFYSANNQNEQTNMLFRKVMFLTSNNKRPEAIKVFEQFVPQMNPDSVSSEYRALLYFAGGDLYFNTGNYQKAEAYLLKAQSLGSSLTNNDRRAVLHRLATLYYKLKDYKKAYDLHYLVHKLIDSVKSKDVLLKVNELETRYRTAEKDKKLAEQQLSIIKIREQSNRDKMIGGSIVAALIISFLILFVRNQRLTSRKEIERLQAVIEGEEKERGRLSRELHDGVNSSLAATKSYLQAMEHLYPDIAQDDPFLKVKQLLLSTATEVRSIAHNLSPNILMANGLKYAIEDFCSNLFDRTVAVEVSSFGIEQNFSQHTSLYLYRIAQELLHNVYKHAQATQVTITIGADDREIFLTIEDNGIGLEATVKQKTGIGLENLKQRINSRNGHITIEAKKTKGTIAHVTLPPEVDEKRTRHS